MIFDHVSEAVSSNQLYLIKNSWASLEQSAMHESKLPKAFEDITASVARTLWINERVRLHRLSSS